MTVAVVTDSTAALPPEVAKEHGVTVVPIWLTIGGRPYQDGTISQQELLDRFDEGISTSGPSPGQFAEAIESSMGDDGAVVLTVSGNFSATPRAARVAAAGFGELVVVVDTEMVASAQALVVLAAARAAAAGASLADVEGAARAAIGRVDLVATLDTLEYLVRSGRIPGVAGWVGQRARLRPVVEFNQGRIRPLRPAFSRDASVDRVFARWRRSRREGESLHVAALHSMDEEAARRLLERVQEEARPQSSFISEFGAVMVAYTGPGVVGLAWHWEPHDGA
jgi:DegV family protein with EDD domain